MRDSAAFLGLIVAPLALSLALGAAFGGGGTSGVPTVVVDLDGAGGGRFGPLIAGALSSDQLSSLIGVTRADDAATARATVDDGGASSRSSSGGPERPGDGDGGRSGLARRGLWPARPRISAQIVRGVVAGVLAELVAGSTAARVTLASLVEGGYLDPADLATRGGAIGEAAAADARDSAAIAVEAATGEPVEAGVSFGDVFGPSMAVLFLMFATTMGGRRILDEREGGTLSRLLVTPTTAVQVLGGKLAGIAAGGLLQMTILLAAMTLLFGLAWSSLPGVVLLTVALVLAATAWGILIAAWARTAGQAATAGTAITLIFAIVGGNFLPRANMPEPLRTASLLTPNAWGIDGYGALLSGGTLGDIALGLVALLAMTALLGAPPPCSSAAPGGQVRRPDDRPGAPGPRHRRQRPARGVRRSGDLAHALRPAPRLHRDPGGGQGGGTPGLAGFDSTARRPGGAGGGDRAARRSTCGRSTRRSGPGAAAARSRAS